MHRCLQITDILHMVTDCLSQQPRFAFTEDQGLESIDTKALLSLSLTSKSLLEPCLDALWSCMFSARPLLDLMIPHEKRPRNILEDSDGNLEEDSWDVESPPYHEIMDLVLSLDHADMTRFYYYASRVKGLRVVGGDLDILLSRTLSTWSSPRAKPLLRNLRYLNWRDSDTQFLPCIVLFAGPNLANLRLHTTDWRRDCEGILFATLSAFRQACPLLDNVETEHMHASAWVDPLVFCAFSNVARVEFSRQPIYDMLLCLSRMPNLHTLRGTFVPWTPFAWGAPTPLVFPALRHLHWAVFTFDEATTLFQRLRLPDRPRELETLTLHRDSGDFPPAELPLFLDALRTTCAPHALTAFSLRIIGIHTPTIVVPPAPAGALLRPLLGFARLETLSIDDLPLTFDDAWLAALSAAWPRLRVLVLTPQQFGESSITPAGLRPLAAHNPRLEMLQVHIHEWPESAAAASAETSARAHAQRPVLPVTININNGFPDESAGGWWDSLMPQATSALHYERRAARIQVIRSIFPHAKVLYQDLRASSSD